MSSARGRLLAGVDHVAALDELQQRPINYTAEEVRAPAWNFDAHRHLLGTEQPGPAEPGGIWETACRLVGDYEFSTPERIRAIYFHDSPLLGRDLLLEGRFYGLRFHMGVRVTSVVDEMEPQRAWGWAYETLEGHLERGKMSYQVVKHPASGRVEFLVEGHSQLSPAVRPLLSFGWAMFGRRTQLGFYRRCGARLARLVHESPADPRPVRAHRADGVVLAPSDAVPQRFDTFGARVGHPG